MEASTKLTSSTFSTGPQPIRDDYPEVAHFSAPEYLEPSHDGKIYYQPGSTSPIPTSDGKRRIFGFTILTLVLLAIIVFLTLVAIGLAVATGVQSHKANDANTSLAALEASPITATVVASAPAPTGTNLWNTIDNGCSNTPDQVDKTKYTTFSLFGERRFTMFCDADTPNSPLFSLFVADFNSCMDSCASYSKYAVDSFGNVTDANCAGVSFIPLWTDKDIALAGNAPGNCYLKPGPQNETALKLPNIGTECHAAILDNPDASIVDQSGG